MQGLPPRRGGGDSRVNRDNVIEDGLNLQNLLTVNGGGQNQARAIPVGVLSGARSGLAGDSAALHHGPGKGR